MSTIEASSDAMKTPSVVFDRAIHLYRSLLVAAGSAMCVSSIDVDVNVKTTQSDAERRKNGAGRRYSERRWVPAGAWGEEERRGRRSTSRYRRATVPAPSR